MQSLQNVMFIVIYLGVSRMTVGHMGIWQEQ